VNFDLPGIVRNVPNPPHVFIPNDYRDMEFARKLAAALRRDRVSPYIDVGEMAAGDSLVRRLASAMRPVDCVVPVISVASVTHRWVETGLADVMRREINRRRIRAFPAKIDNCTLPPSLAGQFVADFHSLGWNRAYEVIGAAIRGRSAPASPVLRRPVKRAPEPALPAEDVASAPAGAKEVYLSFDHENDGYYKDVLLTWSKMPGFARLRVNDEPPAVPADSELAEPIKQTLAKRIGAASGLLCVIGAKSSSNRWMEWEIKKADQLGKRIIAVRISRDCEVPELLSDIGATCALSFTFEGIRRAIDEAYGGSALD